MKRLLTTALACLLIGTACFAGGWYSHERRSDREMAEIALVHHLERLSYAANGLRCVRLAQPDRLNRLLLFGVTSSVDAANAEIAAGTQLPSHSAFPSIREGIERAQLETSSADPSLAPRLAALQSRLGKPPTVGTP